MFYLFTAPVPRASQVNGRRKSGVMSLFNISLSSHVFKLSSQPAELSFASAVRMKKLWDLANNTGTVVGTCGRCSVAT